MPDSVPRIREYEIIAGPFSGTYGEVLIGKHCTLGFKRAIKRLHDHVRPELMHEEALKQKTVRSPHVVQIYDFFQEERDAILMEYCPIGLEQYLRERFIQTGGKLPFEEAREVLHGILLGLNDAHNAGVVHGDIKPANVRFGEDQLPKLTDFGAARRFREAAPALKGSTNWMAPEVIRGGEATPESDYFSFGILAYLILSATHPFYANDPTCLTSEDDNIVSETFQPVPLSSVRPDVPRPVAELVMELLTRDQSRSKAEAALKAALS